MGRKARAKREPRDRGGPKSRAHPAMSRRTKQMVGVFMALLVVGSGVGAWQWLSARSTPEPAPYFNLPASTGKRIALEDYVGKQEVVLLFYMGAG
jgi:hypothetical protein